MSSVGCGGPDDPLAKAFDDSDYQYEQHRRVQRGVEAAWVELERQSLQATHPYVNFEDSTVDGFIDMPDLVYAILEAVEKTDANRS